MLDFCPASRGIRMNQQPDTHGQRARHRDLPGMQECYNAPAKFFGGAGREGGIQIIGDGEQSAHNVIGLEPVSFDERAQQLIGGGENFCRIVARDCRGSADPLEPDWG